MPPSIIDPGLVVALGDRRYRVQRPWGQLPPGRVTDVAADAGGRVLVLLRRDRCVEPPGPAVAVLGPDGRLLAAWGEEVADAHALTVAPDGRVAVVDRDAHEVILFAPDGRRVGGLGRRHAPGDPFNAPSDVAFAPDGCVFVADGYGASLVHRFAPDGTPLGRWGAPGDAPGEFSTPHALWVLPDGRVAVADRENDRVQLFSPEGAPLSVLRGLPGATAVFADAAGLLHVTDRVPRLSVFAPDGRLVGRCRPVLNGAHGLWGTPDGTLLLAEPGEGRITRLLPQE